MKAISWAVASLTIALTHVHVVHAGDVLDKTQYFDIAPGALDTAVLEFAKQAKVAVSTDGELLRRYRTRGMRGTESARVALETLLSESGLTFRVVGNAVLVLRPVASDRPLPLTE